jgi:hypothetical protein
MWKRKEASEVQDSQYKVGKQLCKLSSVKIVARTPEPTEASKELGLRQKGHYICNDGEGGKSQVGGYRIVCDRYPQCVLASVLLHVVSIYSMSPSKYQKSHWSKILSHNSQFTPASGA